MKDEGKKHEAPKTVPRPAVPADYLKTRPKLYLNAISKVRNNPILGKEDIAPNLKIRPRSNGMHEEVSIAAPKAKISSRVLKRAEKAKKKAERLAVKQALRPDSDFGIKNDDDTDIGSVWREQKEIREADEKLEKEYRATKEKSKQLKRKIKDLNSDGDNLNLKGILGPDKYEKVITTKKEAKKVLRYSAKKLKPVYQKAAKAARRSEGATKTNLKTKKNLILLGSVILAIGGGSLLITHKKSEGTANNANKTTQVAGKTIFKPDFDVVKLNTTPDDKVIFDPERKVASFEVSTGMQTVTISQQQLPDSFKNDPAGELSNLASSIYATKELSYSGGKAYLGQSAKGPQTVVLVKKGLLIFLASSNIITDTQWTDLINSLQ